MSTIAPATVQSAPHSYDVHITTWDMAAGDSADPFRMPESSDRSIQIDGVHSGAVAGIEGSIDGTTYFTLTDPQGVAISGSSPRLKAIVELVAFVRPFVTGGDINTALHFRLLAKKAR